MELDQYFTFGKLTLSDLAISIVLIGITCWLDTRMKKRRMQHIEYSMASNIENMAKIFEQTSKYVQSIMDDSDGVLWINYLKKYMEINRDTIQNYYEQMHVNFKELDNSDDYYTKSVKIIMDKTEWVLYSFFNKILTTNESNIIEYRKLGTKFNKYCKEFFNNIDILQKNNKVNYLK